MTSTDTLRPGTALRIEVGRDGVVDAALGYHDTDNGVLIVRILGLPGLHAFPRTSLRSILNEARADALGLDSTGRQGFACGEYEVEPDVAEEAVLARNVEEIQHALYGRRLPGTIWPDARDVARGVSALLPDADIDLDRLTDYVHNNDELGYMPTEIAERIVSAVLAGEMAPGAPEVIE